MLTNLHMYKPFISHGEYGGKTRSLLSACRNKAARSLSITQLFLGLSELSGLYSAPCFAFSGARINSSLSPDVQSWSQGFFCSGTGSQFELSVTSVNPKVPRFSTQKDSRRGRPREQESFFGGFFLVFLQGMRA